MVRITEAKPFNEDGAVCEVMCLSTDTKPDTGIIGGSMCLETDTGKLYVFSEGTGWVLYKTIKEG